MPEPLRIFDKEFVPASQTSDTNVYIFDKTGLRFPNDYYIRGDTLVLHPGVIGNPTEVEFRIRANIHTEREYNRNYTDIFNHTDNYCITKGIGSEYILIPRNEIEYELNYGIQINQDYETPANYGAGLGPAWHYESTDLLDRIQHTTTDEWRQGDPTTPTFRILPGDFKAWGDEAERYFDELHKNGPYEPVDAAIHTGLSAWYGARLLTNRILEGFTRNVPQLIAMTPRIPKWLDTMDSASKEFPGIGSKIAPPTVKDPVFKQIPGMAPIRHGVKSLDMIHFGLDATSNVLLPGMIQYVSEEPLQFAGETLSDFGIGKVFSTFRMAGQAGMIRSQFRAGTGTHTFNIAEPSPEILAELGASYHVDPSTLARLANDDTIVIRTMEQFNKQGTDIGTISETKFLQKYFENVDLIQHRTSAATQSPGYSESMDKFLDLKQRLDRASELNYPHADQLDAIYVSKTSPIDIYSKTAKPDPSDIDGFFQNYREQYEYLIQKTNKEIYEFGSSPHTEALIRYSNRLQNEEKTIIVAYSRAKMHYSQELALSDLPAIARAVNEGKLSLSHSDLTKIDSLNTIEKIIIDNKNPYEINVYQIAIDEINKAYPRASNAEKVHLLQTGDYLTRARNTVDTAQSQYATIPEHSYDYATRIHEDIYNPDLFRDPAPFNPIPVVDTQLRRYYVAKGDQLTTPPPAPRPEAYKAQSWFKTPFGDNQAKWLFDTEYRFSMNVEEVQKAVMNNDMTYFNNQLENIQKYISDNSVSTNEKQLLIDKYRRELYYANEMAFQITSPERVTHQNWIYNLETGKPFHTQYFDDATYLKASEFAQNIQSYKDPAYAMYAQFKPDTVDYVRSTRSHLPGEPDLAIVRSAEAPSTTAIIDNIDPKEYFITIRFEDISGRPNHVVLRREDALEMARRAHDKSIQGIEASLLTDDEIAQYAMRYIVKDKSDPASIRIINTATEVDVPNANLVLEYPEHYANIINAKNAIELDDAQLYAQVTAYLTDLSSSEISFSNKIGITSKQIIDIWDNKHSEIIESKASQYLKAYEETAIRSRLLDPYTKQELELFVNNNIDLFELERIALSQKGKEYIDPYRSPLISQYILDELGYDWNLVNLDNPDHYIFALKVGKGDISIPKPAPSAPITKQIRVFYEFIMSRYRGIDTDTTTFTHISPEEIKTSKILEIANNNIQYISKRQIIESRYAANEISYRAYIEKLRSLDAEYSGIANFDAMLNAIHPWLLGSKRAFKLFSVNPGELPLPLHMRITSKIAKYFTTKHMVAGTFEELSDGLTIYAFAKSKDPNSMVGRLLGFPTYSIIRDNLWGSTFKAFPATTTNPTTLLLRTHPRYISYMNTITDMNKANARRIYEAYGKATPDDFNSYIAKITPDDTLWSRKEIITRLTKEELIYTDKEIAAINRQVYDIYVNGNTIDKKHLTPQVIRTTNTDNLKRIYSHLQNPTSTKTIDQLIAELNLDRTYSSNFLDVDEIIAILSKEKMIIDPTLPSTSIVPIDTLIPFRASWNRGMAYADMFNPMQAGNRLFTGNLLKTGFTQTAFSIFSMMTGNYFYMMALNQYKYLIKSLPYASKAAMLQTEQNRGIPSTWTTVSDHLLRYLNNPLYGLGAGLNTLVPEEDFPDNYTGDGPQTVIDAARYESFRHDQYSSPYLSEIGTLKHSETGAPVTGVKLYRTGSGARQPDPSDPYSYTKDGLPITKDGDVIDLSGTTIYFDYRGALKKKGGDFYKSDRGAGPIYPDEKQSLESLAAQIFFVGSDGQLTPTPPERSEKLISEEFYLGLPTGTLFEAYVTRVIDGDTIEIKYGMNPPMTIRILGIDTPETDGWRNNPARFGDTIDQKTLTHHGKFAKRYVAEILEGRTVLIKIPSGSFAFDAYGRVLAYVYYPSVNGEYHDLSLTLISEGLARKSPYVDPENDDLYAFAEMVAKGLASPENPDEIDDSNPGQGLWFNYKKKKQTETSNQSNKDTEFILFALDLATKGYTTEWDTRGSVRHI